MGNGQKKDAFWERIMAYLTEHYYISSPPVRFLESKFHIICHDVSEFSSYYA
jgi:hypothetical protein